MPVTRTTATRLVGVGFYFILVYVGEKDLAACVNTFTTRFLLPEGTELGH